MRTHHESRIYNGHKTDDIVDFIKGRCAFSRDYRPKNRSHVTKFSIKTFRDMNDQEGLRNQRILYTGRVLEGDHDHILGWEKLHLVRKLIY